MDNIVYLNGQFLPFSAAKISPMDRGCVFGDGVYEVISAYNGKLFDLEPHIDRLNTSLKNIRMQPPHSHQEWDKILHTLLEKNGGGDQWVYLQVTRGLETMRNHTIPSDISPTVFAMFYEKPRPKKEEAALGVKAGPVRDIRWKNCHVKTTARLAYVLMYQEAKDAGFEEAIIINNDQVLEGTISNVFIVQHDVLITPPKSSYMLSGITRDRILDLAKKHKISYREKEIKEEELFKADEIWITNTTRSLNPVLNYAGHVVGSGKAGPLWSKMWDLYWDTVKNI